MKIYQKPASVLIFICIFLTACANQVQKSPRVSQLNIPSVWQQESDLINAQIKPKDEQSWLYQLNDPTLWILVKTALDNNPDLQASAAQLQEAIEQIRLSRANRIPQANANFRSNRTDASNAGTPSITSYQLGVDLNWELDVWGRLGDLVDSQRLNAAAQSANYAAARNALIINVARAWYDYIEAQQLFEIAKQRLASLENSLDIVQDNYLSGFGSALDFFLARTDLANQQAQISASKNEIVNRRLNLNRILGLYPGQAIETITESTNFPAILPPIPAGLPSEILIQRPDVLAAQLRWQSAESNYNAANKAIYPSFDLTISADNASRILGNVLSTENLIWSIIGNISQTVFDAGTKEARAQIAKAQSDQALSQYVSVLLDSFTEVETGIALQQSLGEQLEQNIIANENSQLALEQAREQYILGLDDVLTLLTAERNSFVSQSQVVSLKNQQIQNLLSVYLALGGDYAADRDDLIKFIELSSKTTILKG